MVVQMYDMVWFVPDISAFSEGLYIKDVVKILPILGEAFALYPYNWLKDMHLDSTRGLGLFANWAILLGSILLFVTHGSTLLTLGLLPTWARFNLTQLIFGDGSPFFSQMGKKVLAAIRRRQLFH